VADAAQESFTGDALPPIFTGYSFNKETPTGTIAKSRFHIGRLRILYLP
jgi:hypothetical protein